MPIIVTMNLASVDLNLLVAFEALMEERHVTRAGQRIGLAQPSMSNALTRLRALMGDDLFLRTTSGMEPTAKALALAGPVSEALRQIRGVLDQEPDFAPTTARHHFTIGVTDYGDLILIPLLIEALRREAPGVDLTVRPIISPAESLLALERGEIDILIGGHLPQSPRTIRQSLFEERFVCIRAIGRATTSPALSKQDYLGLPHILFSSVGGDGMPGVVDAILSEQKMKRRIVATLPHVVAVPFAVAGSDLVATMAERVARRFATSAGVAIVPLPFDVPPFAIDLVRTRRGEGLPAIRWLCDLIARISGTV